MDYLQDGFEGRGFLCPGSYADIPQLRQENQAWFQLAELTNEALMIATRTARDLAKTTSMSVEAIGTRIALRSCGTFQGVVLLSERGMIAEARMLTRSLVENAVYIAALHYAPEEFITALESDSEASRKRQANFILAENLTGDDAARQRLQETVEQIGKVNPLNVKNMAALSPVTGLYLTYQRLSDDAAHLTARSLHRHVNPTPQGWYYRWGPGNAGEIAATLHYAVLAATNVGVAITQMLGDKEGNARFGELSERFLTMPKVEII